MSNFIPYDELKPEQKQMVDSADYRQRYEAAQKGYGLDWLVNSKDYTIRYVIADQGYGLDELVNDYDPFVARMAQLRCNGDIDEWIEANPDKCVLCTSMPQGRRRAFVEELQKLLVKYSPRALGFLKEKPFVYDAEYYNDETGYVGEETISGGPNDMGHIVINDRSIASIAETICFWVADYEKYLTEEEEHADET